MNWCAAEKKELVNNKKNPFELKTKEREIKIIGKYEIDEPKKKEEKAKNIFRKQLCHNHQKNGNL